MPNGFQRGDDTWARLEAPLLRLDADLDAFARAHGLSVGRNYHDYPERSLTWGAPIRRLIQIYLEDEDALTWNVWLCASEDRGAARYWKQAFVMRGVPFEAVERDLPGLFETAMAEIETWTSEQFEFATELS